MGFPVITHIDQLREKVGHIKEIRFSKQPNGTTVVCYMISDEDTFGGENADWERECRGITFGPDGKILSRPLHKFFNVGEREETQKYNLKWDEITRVMDKRDGSMVHPVLLGDQRGFKVVMKSKKSFESDVAVNATAFIENREGNGHGYWHLCWDLLLNGYTPIFEWTAPNARIVINYGNKPQLQLLHVRNTVAGDYWSKDRIVEKAKLYGVPVVNHDQTMSPQDLMDNLETLQDVEGFVFQFANGDMVKAKTKWYLELHHAVTFQTYRSVAEMVLSETIDDFKSYLSQVGASMVAVYSIEKQIVDEIDQIMTEVEAKYETVKGMERKDVAIQNKDFQYFKLLMDRYSGKDIDYKEFYRKNFLKERFSVEQIGE